MTSKKIIIIILAILLVVGVVYGASRLFRSVNKPAQSAAAKLEQKTLAEGKAIKQTFTAIEVTDKDLDGLSDVEEAKLGTNPNLADTDGDGINDYDEVNIYKTNPLKYDTYGLGHSDLWGVRSGKILRDGKVVR